ncbi:hypothetical protein SLEP1_g37847 [Rubroshorea leprosula]|uniref:Uncharacterized protein n=1 Tax=Rubroshorea leprosula TaxID=152421 RepID=A0AAV5KWJ0_9ROSI|nr:hypothetical protein SLEP1_g37847 [Rubroshorea leprosula]
MEMEMEMNLFRIDLGLAHCSESDCAERGGGLTLFWNDAFNLQVSSFSPYHIDVEIVDPGGCQWQLIRLSGQPETTCREESWTHLKSPKTVSPLPWMRLGDINDILSKSEMEKGNLRFWSGYAWGAIVGKRALVPLITYDSKGWKRIGKDGNMFGSTCRQMGAGSGKVQLALVKWKCREPALEATAGSIGKNWKTVVWRAWRKDAKSALALHPAPAQSFAAGSRGKQNVQESRKAGSGSLSRLYRAGSRKLSRLS